MNLGATKFINTGEKGFETQVKGTLDLIISTADVSHGIPTSEFFLTLNVGGCFIMVGLPDKKLPAMSAKDFVKNGALLGGSKIGSKKEALAMLKLASEKNVRPWIQVLPMEEAGKAVKQLKDNKVRYRNVLRQDIAVMQLN